MPGIPAISADPVKSSYRTYNNSNVSPLVRPVARDMSKPRMSGMLTPIHASNPPHFPKKDTPQNQEPGSVKNDEEKISSDHISVVFYATLDDGPALEFFMRKTDLGYAFFETPTPGPLDPWRVPLDKYLKKLFLPTSLVQGLLRLDRWAVPGMERMVSHAVCSVKVARDHRENVLDVSTNFILHCKYIGIIIVSCVNNCIYEFIALKSTALGRWTVAETTRNH